MNLKAVALAAIASACLADAAQAAPSPQFFGTWTVDVSKLPPAPGPGGASQPPPKSITITFSDAGGGKVSQTVEIVGADGSIINPPVVTFSADGSPTPIAGNPNFDAIAATSP